MTGFQIPPDAASRLEMLKASQVGTQVEDSAVEEPSDESADS